MENIIPNRESEDGYGVLVQFSRVFDGLVDRFAIILIHTRSVFGTDIAAMLVVVIIWICRSVSGTLPPIVSTLAGTDDQ